MQNARYDFEKRKEEVESYFYFLEIIDKDDVCLKFRKKDDIVEEQISNQLQKILIANGFILLYNLIEATVRSSLLEIYLEVKENNISFDRLSENLKKIWIRQCTDNFREGNFKQDTLNRKIIDIAESVLKKETVLLLEENLDISGNLDAKKIRELADKFGFESPKNGRDLVIIKNKRNRLAHGELTFSEIGRDYTVSELKKFKDDTFIFISEVIDKVNDYIITRKYVK